ncbi:MAG: TonB-dependent receptor [Acidobacteria bacterium]|nr:TonB-dependent receptor [Acidobacteriota bacterium]
MRTLWLLLAAPLAAQQKEVIVVTGTYEPVPLEEADRPVRSEPVRGPQTLISNSPTDFLNRDSSVDLRQRGSHNIQTDVSIRGSTFGQTLVLIDGMRMNDVQSGHHNLDLPLAMESIESVEILKGSGSTLYGSDAVGGVIHFITRPPEASEFRVRTGIGNFGVNQQRVSGAYVRGALSQQLAATRDFSTGFIPNRDYRNLALTSGTQFKGTSVLLGHSDKPFGAEQYYGNFNSWERTKTWFATARQRIGERTTVSTAFRRHTDLFVLFRDRPQVFTNRHAAKSWQASFRRWEDLGHGMRLHYGAEGLHDTIASTNLGNHSRARAAAYAALDARALRRYSFSVGVREELLGSADSQVSPTAAVGAWITGNLKLRASLSRAFRLPTFTDLYYRDPANQGSADLRPERAWSYEGGLDWNAGGRLRGSVTVFQRRERDGIDYVRRSPTEIWRATNFQSIRFTGVEASAVARVRGKHLLDLSYTGLTGFQNQLAGIFSRYTFNYASSLGVASWQTALGGDVVLRARLGAVQRFARDPYAVLDIYAARTRGRWHPFVHLTNLSDSVYQEIFGVRMPGRAAVAGVEVKVW